MLVMTIKTINIITMLKGKLINCQKNSYVTWLLIVLFNSKIETKKSKLSSWNLLLAKLPI